MKLNYRQIEPFISNPDPAARVILIYGPDTGLVKERGAVIGKTVVADLNDPFNVAVLTSEQLTEDPARLNDEANAISMMGGDRLIRVDGASDKISTIVKSYLENPSDQSLVLLIAGELGPRSSLRLLCEKAKNAAAIPCYVEDEKDLSRLIRHILQDAGKAVDLDAVQWLAANISGDRAKVRSELEKLITYKGDEKTPISLDDVIAACGAAGVQSIDGLVYSVAGRKSAEALKAYSTLIAEGVPIIAILRALQNHFRRLHYVKSGVSAGKSIDEAMKGLRPPVFFKVKNAFISQVNSRSLSSLDHILIRLSDLEAQCKTTGMPTEILCSQAILSISTSRN